MAIAQKMIRYAMRADSGLGTARRFLFGEKPGLTIVLFHNIFHDESSVTSGLAYPQEGVTQAQFRSFLNCCRRAGYRFVSSQDVTAGLNVEGKYVLLTFDDGYHSILDILSILEEYQAPATLFVASYNVEAGHAYWPDIVYREEVARGKSAKESSTLVESLKDKQSSDIQQYILQRYGSVALFPIHDSARPLTVKELASLACHPLIDIGNHTTNHVDLTVCNVDEIRREISNCQKAVERITGKIPIAISYPFGRFNAEVLGAARAEGMLLGFTCEEGKNLLPLNSPLELSRYDFRGDSPPSAQCSRFRSDVHFCWPIIKKMLPFLTHRLPLRSVNSEYDHLHWQERHSGVYTSNRP